MGKLTFVRQTRNSITEITLALDRFVAEVSKDPYGGATLHLLSVFGGDQEIAAIAAAVTEEHRFQLTADGTEFQGSLGEKPVLYRGSIPLRGRKRPVRHLIAVSQDLFRNGFGADAGAKRTILFDGSPAFVLHRLSTRFGLPTLPEWANWFQAELQRCGLVEEITGLNCSPVVVKGTKLRLLRILGQGLRRKAIVIPDTGNSRISL
jgi:hypothetical protein